MLLLWCCYVKAPPSYTSCLTQSCRRCPGSGHGKWNSVWRQQRSGAVYSHCYFYTSPRLHFTISSTPPSSREHEWIHIDLPHWTMRAVSFQKSKSKTCLRPIGVKGLQEMQVHFSPCVCGSCHVPFFFFMRACWNKSTGRLWASDFTLYFGVVGFCLSVKLHWILLGLTSATCSFSMKDKR